MRLWHEFLISNLPRQQLLGQHRECCALRGNGWGKKHKTVNYVFDYNPHKLFLYHCMIMEEMEIRGYKPNNIWKNRYYRGKKCLPWEKQDILEINYQNLKCVYKEHDMNYLKECLQNLENKGIIII